MTSPSTDRRLGLLGSTAMKAPVTVAATTNITQRGEQTIDGVAVHAVNAAGIPDRVLCTGQTDKTQNGIWDVSLTDWTRSIDADGNYDLKNGTFLTVGSGTINAQTAWGLAATDPVIPGSSVMTWAKAVWNTLAAALFQQSGTGSLARSSQDKMRERVSVSDFGVVGDSNGTAGSGTDNTAVLALALNYAKSIGAELYFPPGIYRVTAGYTQATAYQDVLLRGQGKKTQNYVVGSPANGATIVLDSTDPASFFMDLSASATTLDVDGVEFQCAQFVKDREFFRFSGGLTNHYIRNSCFQRVEKPINYKPGVYFQSSVLESVTFSNSGTFHSTAVDLCGTLLTLINVNHEGSVPDNTDKVVCNLTGVRKIAATNFLLEGALPAAGWTVMRLHNLFGFDAPYTRTPFAQFVQFWSEWSTFAPTYCVDQIGGAVDISGNLGLTLTSKYKLSSMAHVNLNGVNFTGTLDDPTQFFELEDAQCTVNFIGCPMRGFDLTKLGFNHIATHGASIDSSVGAVVVSNTAPSEIFRWRGGFPVAEGATHGGNVPDVSTDATYKRKLVFTPAGSPGTLNDSIRVPFIAKAGTLVSLLCTVKLPTFASGLWKVTLGTATKDVNVYFDTTNSGAVVNVNTTVMLPADETQLSVTMSNGTSPGATGGTVVELYELVFFHGNSVPRSIKTVRPKNIATESTAAPTTGTWAVGDRVRNSAPAVGSPKGWSCTVAGTPGTWVSEGNL